MENGIRMLPIDSIRPFRKHPFRLYEGERLEDMVESIKEHGVLNPVIVWQEGDGYEMLAGHNRQDTAGTCGHDVHRLKSRDAIGEEYGMTGRNIARYMQVQKLEEPLKERLDEGTLPLVAAVDLSYLSEMEQEVVSGLADTGKIKLDVKTAKCVRGMAGNVTEEAVLGALYGGKGKKAAAGRSVKLSAEVYERYFGNVKPADVGGYRGGRAGGVV